MTLLRIYGFKTVYTLAGGANVVANCAILNGTEASPWDTNICETTVQRDQSSYGVTQQSISVNSARMEITPRVSLEPSLSVNFVDLPQASFTATVVRTRATYTVTPRMFVSGIIQYNSATASRGSNLRLRWEYAPGSELFVVYTDDYDTESRAASTALRNRAFVVKVNRLFRP